MSDWNSGAISKQVSEIENLILITFFVICCENFTLNYPIMIIIISELFSALLKFVFYKYEPENSKTSVNAL